MKKIFSLLFVFFLSLSSTKAYFADVSDMDPWFTSVIFLQNLGYLQGYPSSSEAGLFMPEKNINRAEFLKLTFSVYGVDTKVELQNCFTDVHNEWFAKYVCGAKNLKIINGYANGSFKPESTITHAEALKIIESVAGFEKDLSTLSAVKSAFADVTENDWFKNYYIVGQKRNLLVFNGEYVFPNALLTRGYAAEYVFRALMIKLTKYPIYNETKALEFIQKNTGMDLSNPITTTNSNTLTSYDEIKSLITGSHPKGDTITDEAFTISSLKGLAAAAGDPYTDYFPKVEADTFMSSLEGELQGIGVEIESTKFGLLIMNVFPGTPAEKNGIVPGDVIVTVEGEGLSTLTPTQMVNNIRGKPGTIVHIEIQPRDTETRKQLTIVREQINVPSVIGKDLNEDPKIGYVRLVQFNSKTADELLKVLQNFDAQGKKGIILDLRGNGGGLLDSSIFALSMFLPPDTKVGTAEVKGNVLDSFLTTNVGYTSKLPLVLLIDGYTASASEIMAAALSEIAHVPLVGETSFGKGAVQQLFTLSDGSELKMTIAYLYTPNHNNVGTTLEDRKGLKPDIEIDDDKTTAADEQVGKALEKLRTLITQ